MTDIERDLQLVYGSKWDQLSDKKKKQAIRQYKADKNVRSLLRQQASKIEARFSTDNLSAPLIQQYQTPMSTQFAKDTRIPIIEVGELQRGPTTLGDSGYGQAFGATGSFEDQLKAYSDYFRGRRVFGQKTTTNTITPVYTDSKGVQHSTREEAEAAEQSYLNQLHANLEAQVGVTPQLTPQQYGEAARAAFNEANKYYQIGKQNMDQLGNAIATTMMVGPGVLTGGVGALAGLAGGFTGGTIWDATMGNWATTLANTGIFDNVEQGNTRDYYQGVVSGMTNPGTVAGGMIAPALVSAPSVSINPRLFANNAMNFVRGYTDNFRGYSNNLGTGEVPRNWGVSTPALFGLRKAGAHWGAQRGMKGAGKGSKTQGRKSSGNVTKNYESDLIPYSYGKATWNTPTTNYISAYEVTPNIFPYRPFYFNWELPSKDLEVVPPVVVPPVTPPTRLEELTTTDDPWVQWYAQQPEGTIQQWPGHPNSPHPAGEYAIKRVAKVSDPVVKRRRVANTAGYVAPDSTTYESALQPIPGQVINTLQGGIDPTAVIDYNQNIFK